MACQILGKEPVYFGESQEALFFTRGTPHRFWNAGEDELTLSSWVKPVNNILFFLSTFYAAQKNSGSTRPEAFDTAYLMVRYKMNLGCPNCLFL